MFSNQEDLELEKHQIQIVNNRISRFYNCKQHIG